MPELFEEKSSHDLSHQPLAARMRPRTLDEFIRLLPPARCAWDTPRTLIR